MYEDQLPVYGLNALALCQDSCPSSLAITLKTPEGHSQEEIISVAGKSKVPVFMIKWPQDGGTKVISRRDTRGKR